MGHLHIDLDPFDSPDVKAIVLMGSHARGDAGPHSDVDLVRFRDQRDPGQTHLIDGQLYVISDADPERVESWFTDPEAAVQTIVGLRQGRALIDRDGTFAAVQQRAHDFVWDAGMQAKANQVAGREMIGWIEEVHKGLEGLRRGDDTGRLLNASFGLSWGLSQVVQVQRGILISGDNTFVDEIEAALGADHRWCRLRRQSFGMDGATTLIERVRAGLQLYVATADLMVDELDATARDLVMQTVARIAQA